MGRVSSSYDTPSAQVFERPDGFTWAQGNASAPDPGAWRPYSLTCAMALAQKALQDITLTLVGEVSEVSAKAGYKAVYF